MRPLPHLHRFALKVRIQGLRRVLRKYASAANAAEKVSSSFVAVLPARWIFHVDFHLADRVDLDIRVMTKERDIGHFGVPLV